MTRDPTTAVAGKWSKVSFTPYSTVALVPPMSTMNVWRGIT